jgi:hypothetical protein
VTWRQVTPTLKELRLSGLAWTDDELLQLVETLESNTFRALTVLDLGCGRIRERAKSARRREQQQQQQ